MPSLASRSLLRGGVAFIVEEYAMKAELESLVDQMITRGILFDEAVKEFEKKFILKVVNRHHNNLSKAAEELGIHRNTLSKRIVEYENAVNGHGNGVNGNGHLNGHNGNGKRRQVPPRRKKRLQSGLSKPEAHGNGQG
ncbi:MAG: helix-turn-helix domain-containing protein [Acidobacteriota bacterium]